MKTIEELNNDYKSLAFNESQPFLQHVYKLTTLLGNDMELGAAIRALVNKSVEINKDFYKKQAEEDLSNILSRSITKLQ